MLYNIKKKRKLPSIPWSTEVYPEPDDWDIGKKSRDSGPVGNLGFSVWFGNFK